MPSKELLRCHLLSTHSDRFRSQPISFDFVRRDAEDAPKFTSFILKIRNIGRGISIDPLPSPATRSTKNRHPLPSISPRTHERHVFTKRTLCGCGENPPPGSQEPPICSLPTTRFAVPTSCSGPEPRNLLRRSCFGHGGWRWECLLGC